MKNKSRLFTAALAAALMATTLIWTPVQASDGGLKTLRGAAIQAPETESADPFKVMKDSAPIERDYVQQPPLIPHKTDAYTITMKYNKCMDCHSWTRYKETGATKVSLTHFKTRDGQELSNISPRRYFCQQCHVPQVDAKPLVANKFKPAEGIR
ncbi:nitrate reductase cytochrome c-type subunit [Azonexus sp.]|uniref:nitrate reductase cytochrome c-type subunit n=1 Tax=Azonexus sp. TaxID=1872668 RepID=UPI0027B9D785|nr:nitrate reductase cytochrome c-type subunit [Azonexus sp.]